MSTTGIEFVALIIFVVLMFIGCLIFIFKSAKKHAPQMTQRRREEQRAAQTQKQSTNNEEGMYFTPQEREEYERDQREKGNY